MSEPGATLATHSPALRRTPPTWAIAFLVGVVLGAGLVVAHRAARRPAWRAAQAEYNRLLVARGLDPVPVGIRALSPGQGRGEERCVTCHLAAILPEAFSAAPFGRHPDSGCAAAIGELGCIACHGGEPLAIDSVREAHGRDGSSRRPLRRGGAVEAGCAGCHVSRDGSGRVYRADVTPAVAAGQELFISAGCPACHRIEGELSFDQRGPDLTAVAVRRRPDELRARLLRPQAPPADRRSPMPPVDLGARELDQLVVFLLAQTGAAAGQRGEAWRGRDPGPASLVARLGAPLPSRPNAGAGALWSRRVGCAGCHRAGEDRRGVPDLRFVGLTRDRAHLEAMVSAPASTVPGTAMPALAEPEVVVASIVEYLALQRTPLPSTPAQVFDEICARCHGDRRDPAVVVLAAAPPGLGQACAVDRDAFVETVRGGRPRTAMAPWGMLFSARFVGDLYERRAGRCTPPRGGR